MRIRLTLKWFRYTNNNLFLWYGTGTSGGFRQGGAAQIFVKSGKLLK